MRRVKATIGDAIEGGVWRVIDFDSVATNWYPDISLLVLVSTEPEQSLIEKLRDGGLSNVGWVMAPALETGDIVVPSAHRSEVTVLYRVSDVHHSLQLTNRCNSYCVMCSQPPTERDDHWMFEEALSVVRHMSDAPPVLGLSGGEPLLLGDHLRTLFDEVGSRLPKTRVELLTNGRLLENAQLARTLLDGLNTSVTWLVPLYGHADFLHDFVVQSNGAFEQTLAGLLHLQEYRQSIQLRIVLIRPVLELLPDLCVFVGRNLPFVREVALMACEPIGFALANREMCEVDLIEWHSTLELAARQLARHSVPFLFMNAPLCALPASLHPYAHRSISDWKNVYEPICDSCDVKPQCSGFFAWHERGWKPSKTIAIRNEMLV
ncbi:His-Xaa-Ser system radical SAM maturase HxsC [Bordetella sp. LUAb4]|uniref:His-Xaa-Ser system radical SAM maturase HxsC n=1 Tax=Bordetella sp. LUAb4 TaxID=2843195 RepID=UPI001E35F76D|nr:His-Xaa-Ser system radical SAM maturase HxsC [Bordetella sp. LUAb4]